MSTGNIDWTSRTQEVNLSVPAWNSIIYTPDGWVNYFDNIDITVGPGTYPFARTAGKIVAITGISMHGDSTDGLVKSPYLLHRDSGLGTIKALGYIFVPAAGSCSAQINFPTAYQIAADEDIALVKPANCRVSVKLAGYEAA